MEILFVFSNIIFIFCGLLWFEFFYVNVYLGSMVCLFFVLLLIIIFYNYVKIFRVMRLLFICIKSVCVDKCVEK